MQILNGEEFPPFLKDAPKDMHYPDQLKLPENQKFAMGHKNFGGMPGLFLWNTIFLREHNRLCDILMKEYPQWDDERLFQTARLIVIGLLIMI